MENRRAHNFPPSSLPKSAEPRKVAEGVRMAKLLSLPQSQLSTRYKIPCRVFGVAKEQPKPKGILLHIYGGCSGRRPGKFGVPIIANEVSDIRVFRQDLLLNEIAIKTGLAVVSVEYRLALEHPFPAAPEDFYEVAD